MKLDKTFIATVGPAISRTWGAIRHDIPDCRSNTEAIEIVLDADYMTMYGRDPKACDAIEAAITANGYDKTWHYLARNIRVL